MRWGLEIGSLWCFYALETPKGLFNLFWSHIQPIFASSHRTNSDFPQIVSKYWAKDTEKVISAKLRDKREYEKRYAGALRTLWESALDSCPLYHGSAADCKWYPPVVY